MMNYLKLIALLLALLNTAYAEETPSVRKTENVIFVMTDGLRWQEVFTGAEKALMNKAYGGLWNEAAVGKIFWRDTLEARREVVMPFLWNVMEKQGQIFGNRHRKSDMRVSNGLKFSYPGYNETLSGFADPRIDRNDVGPSPNVSVLEWLHRKPAFQGRVAAFGAWDAFDHILNKDRSGLFVNAGFSPMPETDANPQLRLLNRLKEEIPRTWGEEPVDALTFYSALEYFKQHKPRVFFLALGETDEWGHGGRYDEYLTAAKRADHYTKILWETAQAMPEYRGKTTLLFSTDHGRGSGLTAWKDHNKDVEGSEYTWLAVLGPDTPARGERANMPDVIQNQIAATLAASLGEDYNADVPQAGKPINEVLPAAK